MYLAQHNLSHLHKLMLLGLLSVSIISLSMNIHAETPIAQAPSPQVWQQFNEATVNQYIVPAYARLNDKATLLDKAINQYCSSTGKSLAELQQAQEAFHQTMDVWQSIQNVQFGPIQIFMRNYSFQFWPDKKNHVSKHLAVLLETNDPLALSEDEFHKASVSIKGLPAIERFLFDEDAIKDLKKNPFHCQVLQRISAYTASTAKNLSAEWEDMKRNFQIAGNPDPYFEDESEAATTLLKSLIEPIEVIRDLKLLRPMGSSFGQQKAKRLESWRSERSLRNIKINIESLESMYSHLSPILVSNDDQQIKTAFSEVHNALSQINIPLEKTIDTKQGFKAGIALADALKNLHSALETAVINRGIHLGFNSRDGD